MSSDFTDRDVARNQLEPAGLEVPPKRLECRRVQVELVSLVHLSVQEHGLWDRMVRHGGAIVVLRDSLKPRVRERRRFRSC